jgi:hypothetical protein
MNLVGRVRIIGFGDDSAIEENTRKGVIACSILFSSKQLQTIQDKTYGKERYMPVYGTTLIHAESPFWNIFLPALQMPWRGRLKFTPSRPR